MKKITYPILILVFIAIAGIAITLMNTTSNPAPNLDSSSNPSPTENLPNQVDGKLNIEEICNSALTYMTFPDGESATKFVEECKNGQHPEVIERYKRENNLPGSEAEQVFCTMDAKICPNQSSVGRSGAKCSFDACPFTPQSTTGWKIVSNDDFNIEVPPTWTERIETTNNGLIRQTTLTGKEGSMILAAGVGFGGMCDNTWSKIKIKNDVLEGCYGVNSQNQAQYTQISKPLVRQGDQQQHFDGTVFINPPTEKNSEIIYTILSTLEIK